jgi:uncharacterized membrane protein HdeD (DUF308 family)
MIVHGLFAFINYFYDGLGSKLFNVELIFGIISLLLGIFVALNPITTINLLGIGVGIWLLISGIETMYYSIKLVKAKDEIASLIIFISVIVIAMGISVIINPFAKFMLLNKLIGLFIVANGVFNIVRIILFKKRAKNLLKIFE